MATVNFSVPDEVKTAFSNAFAGQNKSAVIARLMMQAVDDEERMHRRREAMQRIRALREISPPVSAEDIRMAREEVRE
jgi:hypothetical protein